MAVAGDPSLSVGARGNAVLDIQARLVALGYPIARAERGHFGPHTESAVKVFQIRRGLSPDGIVAAQTWRELVEAGWTFGSRTLYMRERPMRGDDVRELQRRLNALGFDAGKEDGIFELSTQEAVQEFQRNTGLRADGIAGHETFESLDRLRRRIGPGSKAAIRERIARELVVGLKGRTIFLDPAHGGLDTGIVTTPGVPEAYIVYRVAEAAGETLDAMGGFPVMSRAFQIGPGVEQRCGIANGADADLAVSFHLACRPEPGPTVTFWSIERTHSNSGRDLAEAIGESLRPRLGPTQILGRNLPFLRQTQMPAVTIDLSCEDNDPLLAEDPYLHALGEAVAHGIEQYFGR